MNISASDMQQVQQLGVVVHKLDKFKLVLGVDWHYAQELAQAKTLGRQLAKQGKGLLAVVRQNADGTWLSAAVPAKAAGAYTAALVVAQAIDSGIVVLPLPDGKLWMLAVSAGCVLPHRDTVVEPGARDDLLSHWIADMGGVHLYGDVSGAVEDAQAFWDRLQQVLLDASSAQRKAWRVGTTSSARLAVLSLLVLGVSLGAWWSIRPASSPQNAPSINMALLQQAEQQQQDAARQRRLKQRFEQEVQAQRKALRDSNVQADMQQLLHWLRNERAPAAWARLAQMKCEAQPQQWTCSPMWNVPISAGTLARVAVAGADAALANSGGGSSDIFPGQPIVVSRQSAQAAPALPVPDALAQAWLRDQWQMSVGADKVQWMPPRDLTVAASSFQEDGQPLRDTPDATIGKAMVMQYSAPLAWWASAAKSSLLRLPGRVASLTYNSNGQLSVQIEYFWAFDGLGGE